MYVCEEECYYVYFIEDEHDHIKIGMSNSLDRRIDAIQTGNADKLKLYYAFIVRNRKDALQLEKEMHNLFSKHKIRREWFDAYFIKRYLRQETITTEKYIFKGLL